MNTEEPTAVTLNLKWVYLAWFGMGFTSLVISAISAVGQDPPQQIISRVGIDSFSVFALALYSFGSALGVAILALLLRRRGLGFAAVGFVGKLSPKGIAFALAGLLIAFTLYPVTESFMRAVGVPMFWRGDATSALRVGTTMDLALVLVFAVLVGPVSEEIIFRGYLMTALRERMRNLSLVYILAGLIFASAHAFVGPGTVVFIFFWSFIPSFLYMTFGNLYPALSMHMINNVVTYVVFPVWILK